MTRLIDADYVKEHMRASELNGRRLHIMELEERLAVIDEVPTVDAIPIEWMLNDWDSKELEDVGYQVMRRIIADWAERKE